MAAGEACLKASRNCFLQWVVEAYAPTVDGRVGARRLYRFE